MRTKYITFNNAHGVPDIVVFSELQQHADVARAMNAHPVIVDGKVTGSEPFSSTNTLIGAGFIYRDADGHLVCYDRSVSLRLESHPEDSDIATNLLQQIT